MIRISSRATRFYKRGVPCIVFGFIAIGVAILIADGLARGNLRVIAPFLIVPLFVAVVLYAIMRRYSFDLVDEVWDNGDELLVRNKGREERIVLADCEAVSCTRFVNPPRCTLRFSHETEFGRRIAFLPPLQAFNFTQPPVVGELRRRIEEARDSWEDRRTAEATP